MKLVYFIILAIIVLVSLAIRYHYNEIKAGIPTDTVKICPPSKPNNCEYVDEKIVNAVHARALAIANADEAETFPVEASDDFEATNDFSQSNLNDICLSVAQRLKIDVSDLNIPPFKSIHAVILFLHAHQK